MSLPTTDVKKLDCTIRFDSQSHASVLQLFEVSHGDLQFWFGSFGIAELLDFPDQFDIELDDGRKGKAHTIQRKTGKSSHEQHVYVKFFGLSRLE